MQKTSEQLSLVEKNITSKVTSDRRSASDHYINSKTLFREQAALEKWKEDSGKKKLSVSCCKKPK